MNLRQIFNALRTCHPAKNEIVGLILFNYQFQNKISGCRNIQNLEYVLLMQSFHLQVPQHLCWVFHNSHTSATEKLISSLDLHGQLHPYTYSPHRCTHRHMIKNKIINFNNVKKISVSSLYVHSGPQVRCNLIVFIKANNILSRFKIICKHLHYDDDHFGHLDCLFSQ